MNVPSARASRFRGRNVSGVLLLDKPTGITSNAALQEVKKLYFAKKAGHTGSLDPLASGMLPLCFGEATKFSQFLLDSDKQYIVVAKLGEVTNTSDADGDIIKTRDVPHFSKRQIEDVIKRFTGDISQIPSMYSAIKHKGQPLYKLARQGIEVERKPRNVTIYSLELIEQTADTLEFKVHCSKGTYVRNLVEDIGEELGCGAHVIKLTRIAVGPYQENQMISMDQLVEHYEQKDWAALNALLLPEDTMVENYPVIELTDITKLYLLRGQAVQVPHSPTEGMVRLIDSDGEFLGVGEIQDDGKIAPKRLKVLDKRER